MVIHYICDQDGGGDEGGDGDGMGEWVGTGMGTGMGTGTGIDGVRAGHPKEISNIKYKISIYNSSPYQITNIQCTVPHLRQYRTIAANGARPQVAAVS